MRWPAAIAALAVSGVAIAGHSEVTDPMEYARCAGVADARFEQQRRDGETEYLDGTADEAHIFMVLARRLDQGRRSAALHLARSDGHKAMLRQGATDDDLHTEVQWCSDLRQQLDRQGAFVEAPPGE